MYFSKRKIKISGVSKIKDTSYAIMFDRIEAGTYLIAAVLTNGNITIQNLNPRKLRVIALPKPSETEQGQWYFQRYVQHFPKHGEIVFLSSILIIYNIII